MENYKIGNKVYTFVYLYGMLSVKYGITCAGGRTGQDAKTLHAVLKRNKFNTIDDVAATYIKYKTIIGNNL